MTSCWPKRTHCVRVNDQIYIDFLEMHQTLQKSVSNKEQDQVQSGKK